MIELRMATPAEIEQWEDEARYAVDVYGGDWETECDGEPHDWQPINTPRGRAYQCERCFDRTD